MEKVVVTYTNPDLDGVASAFAYSELINKQGESASYYINGVVQKEIEVVCSLFNIKLHNKLEELSNKKIIVVDTNTLSAVDFISPEQIIEVIDHHPLSGDHFENAVVEIQQIGAVCTIIAEKFKEKKIKISRESAILLYYGIISNTINFNAKETTQRDKKMAFWLKEQCNEIDDFLIKYIFTEKSKIDIKNLRLAMEVDEKFKLGVEEIIIGQLEIVGAKSFLKKYEDNINIIINQVKNEYGILIAFINLIDILDGYHIIYAPDKNTQDFLKKYGLVFDGNLYTEKRIVLRKEIKRHLREMLNTKNFKEEDI